MRHPTSEELETFDDGELSDRRASAVGGHLGECAARLAAWRRDKARIVELLTTSSAAARMAEEALISGNNSWYARGLHVRDYLDLHRMSGVVAHIGHLAVRSTVSSAADKSYQIGGGFNR